MAKVIKFRGQRVPLEAMTLDGREFSGLLGVATCRLPAAEDERAVAWSILHHQRQAHGSLANARRAALGNDFTPMPEGAA